MNELFTNLFVLIGIVTILATPVLILFWAINDIVRRTRRTNRRWMHYADNARVNARRSRRTP